MHRQQLRWQCRRGMRELDELLAGYVDHAERIERAHVGQAAREILSACRRSRSVRHGRAVKVGSVAEERA